MKTLRGDMRARASLSSSDNVASNGSKRLKRKKKVALEHGQVMEV
jgi:hypothetical protein